MSYTPLNQYVFQAALSGAFAGTVGAQPIVSPSGATYEEIAVASLAFAEEVDTLWGANPIDIVEYGALLNECSAYWYGRVPASASPATYFVICDAIIAATKEASVQAVVAGYTPPTYPPGGGGGSGNATEFQGVPIDAGAPAESFVYVYDTTAAAYVPRQLTQDDILPGFAITGFSVTGGTIEVGASVTNPTVTASYNELPASAHVTNTDGVNSPLVLTTPFTSGTIVGTFTHAAPATVDATLTATNPAGVTKTDSIAFLNFEFRTFAGTGTAGATSATAAGNTAVLNGGAGTLPNAGLFNSIVGQTFNVTAGGHNIYIVTPDTGTLYTVWRDVNTGLPFAMNPGVTFSFTNQHGVASTYVVYQSTNPLSASYGVTAIS